MLAGNTLQYLNDAHQNLCRKDKDLFEMTNCEYPPMTWWIFNSVEDNTSHTYIYSIYNVYIYYTVYKYIFLYLTPIGWTNVQPCIALIILHTCFMENRIMYLR